MRYELGYPRGRGVAIDVVVSGSPAEAAGLKPNDIIQSYNGIPLRSLTQFIGMIQRTKVGENVELEVWRQREEMKFKPTIVDYDDWRRAAEVKQKARPLADDKVVLQRVGITVRGLTVLERMRGAEGVYVSEVLEQSAGDKEGVQAGDLVLEVNGRRVTEANDMRARLAASAAVQKTQLTLKRDTEVIEVTIPQVMER